MTPYELEQHVANAQKELREDNRQIQNVIFALLCVSLQHAADKEAALNLGNGARSDG